MLTLAGSHRLQRQRAHARWESDRDNSSGPEVTIYAGMDETEESWRFLGGSIAEPAQFGLKRVFLMIGCLTVCFAIARAAPLVLIAAITFEYIWRSFVAVRFDWLTRPGAPRNSR